MKVFYLTSLGVVSLALFFNASHTLYERCDDLCRVLGHELGGKCSLSDSDPRCICQPDGVDVSEYLPTVCEIS